MDISPETYFLVVSKEGNPVTKNNRVLLQTIKDESYVYVPLTPQIKAMFDLEAATVEAVETPETEVETYHSEANYESENNASSDNQDQEVLEGKFYWDHKSTLLMLEEYRKRISKFRNPKFKKKLLWDEITNVMKQNGYLVNSDIVDKKMRNMKNTFRTIVDNNNKKKSTGRGRINWPYFKIFEDIFKEDKSVNITCVMSTIRNSTESTVPSQINTVSSIPQLVEKSLSHCVANDIENANIVNLSSSPVALADATPKRNAKCRQLDRWRKRQLEIEEEKLLELKRVREAIEKSNEIQERKTKILETSMEKFCN